MPESQPGRPLGSFERAMIRTQRHSAFNVVLVLRFVTGPQPAAVARALASLAARHGVLRCRIGKLDGRAALVPGAAPIALDRVARQGDDGWRALAEGALARPFDLAAGPLCHAVLAGPDAGGSAELVLAFPHVLVDGSSGAALVDELLALTAADRDPGGVEGEPLSASARGDVAAPEAAAASTAPDLPLLEERFPPRYQRLARRASVARALARELAGEARFGLALAWRRLPRLAVAPVGGSRVATWELARDDTSTLLTGLRRRRLTLNGALAACWAAAFASARYGGRGGPVRTFTMAGLRRLVTPPVEEEALGSGWAMMRVTLDVPPVPDDAAFATAVCERIHDGLARGDAFSSYLTAEPMMRIVLGPVKQRMGELAVSYTGVARIAARRGALQLADLGVFVSTMDVGPALIVHHRIWEGRLLGSLVYHDHDLGAVTVATIGEEVRRRLRVLAAEEEVSASPGFGASAGSPAEGEGGGAA